MVSKKRRQDGLGQSRPFGERDIEDINVQYTPRPFAGERESSGKDKTCGSPLPKI